MLDNELSEAAYWLNLIRGGSFCNTAIVGLIPFTIKATGEAQQSDQFIRAICTLEAYPLL